MLKYFGTDGVRGVANQGLTPEMAFKLGRDGGYVLTKNKKEGEQAKVLVSRDTRISGQMLEYALISGLLSVGIEGQKVKGQDLPYPSDLVVAKQVIEKLGAQPEKQWSNQADQSIIKDKLKWTRRKLYESI